MEPSAEQITAVEAWLQEAFPAASVTSDGDFTSESRWFRAREPGSSGPAPQLVVSYEAFEDHAAERIVAALERLRAAHRLGAHPGERLMLDRQLRLMPAPRRAAGDELLGPLPARR